MGDRPSPEDVPKAATPDTDRQRCDHICLLDEGHVERGEHHFYGYELPSPRVRAGYSIVPTDELTALRRLRDAAVAWRDDVYGRNPTFRPLPTTPLYSLFDALGEAQR